MILTDKLLMLTLLVTATSSMLYKRYKTRWPMLSSTSSSPSSSSLSSSPSPSLLQMRRHLDAHYKARTRLGTRAKWARDTCRPHGLLLRLEPPLRLAEECGSVLVQSFGCRGGCSSYSQIDPRNATNIIHSCSCCQPLRFMVSLVLIPCRQGQYIRVPVKKALGCSCRPCYAEEAPKDIVKLRDLLTKAAVDTPLPIG